MRKRRFVARPGKAPVKGTDVMCENRERLIGYVYDECDPAERREIEAHLESCHTCRHEIRGLRSVRQDLLAWDVPSSDPIWRPIAPARQESSWRLVPMWGLAAAACATFLVGAAGGAATYALMPQSAPAVTQAPVTTPAATATPAITPAQLAAFENKDAGSDARRARHARTGCRCRAAQCLRQHRGNQRSCPARQYAVAPTE